MIAAFCLCVSAPAFAADYTRNNEDAINNMIRQKAGNYTQRNNNKVTRRANKEVQQNFNQSRQQQTRQQRNNRQPLNGDGTHVLKNKNAGGYNE